MGKQKLNIKKIPWYNHEYGLVRDEWLEDNDFKSVNPLDISWIKCIYLSLLEYMIIKNIKNKFYTELLESKNIQDLYLLYNCIIYGEQEENK